MARKRAAKQEQPEGQDVADSPAATGGNGSMTKTDAVRAALAEGIDQPEHAVKFIKDRFDIDMTRPQFSTNKSLIKKRDGAAGGKKAGRPPKAAAASAPAPKPSVNGPSGLAVQVEAIKGLVDTLGVEQVVSIARLFAK